jgi:hypothetical protein
VPRELARPAAAQLVVDPGRPPVDTWQQHGAPAAERLSVGPQAAEGRDDVKIGLFRNGTKQDSQIKCAYAGCKDAVSLKKASRTRGKMNGTSIELNFAGLSDPQIYEAPSTQSQGEDFPPEEVLNVRWFRLDFFAQHPDLGSVQLGLRKTPHSLGRVQSFSHYAFDASKVYVDTVGVRSAGRFFPAHNYNQFYFQIDVPKLGLQFVSDKPVENAAVIDRIPPINSEYAFKSPVKFQSLGTQAPVEFNLEECQLGMATLLNVGIEVVEFRKISDTRSNLSLRLTNNSDSDEVQIAVLSESLCNITCFPNRTFIDVTRSPAQVDLEIDISNAEPPGTLTLEAILLRPYESRGSNNVLLDYEELRAGVLIPSLPR